MPIYIFLTFGILVGGVVVFLLAYAVYSVFQEYRPDRVTRPLQTRPDSELGFTGIWEKREDGTQTVYSGRHHWTFTYGRDRVR